MNKYQNQIHEMYHIYRKENCGIEPSVIIIPQSLKLDFIKEIYFQHMYEKEILSLLSMKIIYSTNTEEIEIY